MTATPAAPAAGPPRSGGTPAPRSPQDTGPSDGSASEPAPSLLSERELEVAELVVQGRTQKEIGETLFISAKTVEHHVARIRQRLGAGSRGELLAELRRILETR